ncbi:hypothetical protein H1P_860004 [Hyella patelloides LEGE 07179]|uniref:Uncharacterized protein n=1 Tax=Hyella patelloides LEGE 07179 TaxID=945734 RepID=A0A563W4R8_9CYAN|nr:hypothetical protein H1P_860004 [Hyella patelloides LEGE 07179]
MTLTTKMLLMYPTMYLNNVFVVKLRSDNRQSLEMTPKGWIIETSKPKFYLRETL